MKCHKTIATLLLVSMSGLCAFAEAQDNVMPTSSSIQPGLYACKHLNSKGKVFKRYGYTVTSSAKVNFLGESHGLENYSVTALRGVVADSKRGRLLFSQKGEFLMNKKTRKGIASYEGSSRNQSKFYGVASIESPDPQHINFKYNTILLMKDGQVTQNDGTGSTTGTTQCERISPQHQ